VLAFCGLGSLVYGLISASQRGWDSPVVLGSLLAGVALLVGFMFAERHSPAPMMPLDVFQSRTFSGVNLLTLLLYGGLDGAFFFLPFLLIQVHGYSAAAAGAVFLPFTLVLALLSRWGGGLVDRFGARLPLVVGPALVCAAFLLLSLVGPKGDYVRTFLLPMILLGVGMAITVAPLTTTVLNSVLHHQTGVASGINNAVASVAGLVLIAVLGTVGVDALNRSLDKHLQGVQASAEVRQAVEKTRGGFVMPALNKSLPAQSQRIAYSVISSSFVETIRLVMLIAAGLALASAVTAALMVKTCAVSRESPAIP
jgi:nitrate/nitrite transporter NarK